MGVEPRILSSYRELLSQILLNALRDLHLTLRHLLLKMEDVQPLLINLHLLLRSVPDLEDMAR